MFKINKPRRTYGLVRYQFRTQPGTAGTWDYVPRQGMLTFKRFETSKTVSVETKRDHLREQSETFTLELHSPQISWSPEHWNSWKDPFQPCPSHWYEAFDRLPRTRAINATIIDLSGTSYEDQKYGAGYTGQVWGE